VWRQLTERVVAQMTLTDVPLTTLLNEAVVPYEHDEVTGTSSTPTTRWRLGRWRI
jgi:ethanolamine ammonia-lyase large subunit